MNKQDINVLQDLIGRNVLVNGLLREIVAVHIYVSKDGIKSVKVHLKGVFGYFPIETCILL